VSGTGGFETRPYSRPVLFFVCPQGHEETPYGVTTKADGGHSTAGRAF